LANKYDDDLTYLLSLQTLMRRIVVMCAIA